MYLNQAIIHIHIVQLIQLHLLFCCWVFSLFDRRGKFVIDSSWTLSLNMIENVPKLSPVIPISFLKRKIFQDICHGEEHSALEILTMWFKMYPCLSMEVLMEYWESETCEKIHPTIRRMSSLLERGDTMVIREHLSDTMVSQNPTFYPLIKKNAMRTEKRTRSHKLQQLLYSIWSPCQAIVGPVLQAKL